MNVNCISADRRNDWNTFVAQEPSFVLFQSWEWGEFKEKLGWKVFRIAVEERGQIVAGAQLLIRPLPSRLFSMAYIPRGPIGNWLEKETASLLFIELHRIAKLHRTIFLKIEPPISNNLVNDQILRQHGFQRSNYTNQPRATIVLDLKPDIDDIMEQMRDSTRRKIHSALRNGVTIRLGRSEHIPAFHQLIRMTGRREKFSTRSQTYYEQEWQTFAKNDQVALLMAYYQEQLLATHVAYYFGDHAAYFHGTSSYNEYTKFRPNDLLVWEAIKWAKAKGCRTYDLWGIPNEIGEVIFEGKAPPVPDRTDGLWGVYQFKRGFSKNVVSYVGTYDYVYMPQLYALIVGKLFSADTLDRFSAWLDKVKISFG